MMQKSTIVTHTVDQGNLRVQINKTGKETKEHNKHIIIQRKRPKKMFSFKGRASLRVCYCKSKDAEENSNLQFAKALGLRPLCCKANL